LCTVATISISGRGDPISVFAVDGRKDRKGLLQLFRRVGINPQIQDEKEKDGKRHLFRVPCEIECGIPDTGKNHAKTKDAVSALVTGLQELCVPVTCQIKQSSSGKTNGNYRNDHGAHSGDYTPR